jgi:formylglycine-generating enzyme required for sulfatase activity
LGHVGAKDPVGQKKPNACGVDDVHGLMWEWACGYYGDYDPAQNPSGNSSVATMPV